MLSSDNENSFVENVQTSISRTVYTLKRYFLNLDYFVNVLFKYFASTLLPEKPPKKQLKMLVRVNKLLGVVISNIRKKRHRISFDNFSFQLKTVYVFTPPFLFNKTTGIGYPA